MPVRFLTAEQWASYGQFADHLSRAELAARFMFETKDRQMIARRRSDWARLGYGLQVFTVHYLGTFLADPTDVPWELVDHAAGQLSIADPTVIKPYGEDWIRFDHQAEIAEEYGYRDFAGQPGHLRFVRWLFLRAYYGGERPVVLFDQARLHLVERDILLPGVTTLERLVAEVRERATRCLWHRIGGLVSDTVMKRLERLLIVPEGRRTSHLNQLRRPPVKATIPGLVAGLRRLSDIRALGIG